jgi:hypothetical protein
MDAKNAGGWIRLFGLAALFGTALFLTIVSGPKPGRISSEEILAPFYQKGTFLVAVVRIGADMRKQDADLAKTLIAAEYLPIGESEKSVPFDAVIGMEKDAIVVAPGPFFCRDGRYVEAGLPVFETKKTEEVIRYIEAISEAQRKLCAVGFSKNYI